MRDNKLSVWLESHSASEFLDRWNIGGDSRAFLVLEVGYANEGACYNAARNAGIIPGGPAKTGNGEGTSRTPRAPKGTLPIKTAMAICRALGRDPEDYEDMGWNEYSNAYGDLGRDWLELLFTRLGGKESDGGKQFQAWIDYHLALEKAEEEKRARESDPAYKVRVQLDGAKAEIKALKATLANTQARVSELENDLSKARAMSGSRRTNGGNVTVAMKRLMQQRFHPDKQNGNDAEVYTAIAQFINAIETID